MKKLIVLVSLTLVTLVTCVYNKIGLAEKESVLNLALDNKIKSFDPAVAFNDDSLLVIGQSIETLFQYHYLKRPYEVIPLLAEQMPQVSKDGLKYTINIKKGINYHYGQNKELLGREVQAEDFIWQIKRLAFSEVKSTGQWLFAGKLKGFDEFHKNVKSMKDFYTYPMEGLRAINQHTLEITLTKRDPNLLYFLSMPFTAPIPLEMLKKYNNDLSGVIIGTGPYEFTGINADTYQFKKFTKAHEEYYPSHGDRYANTEDLLASSKQKLPFIEKLNFRVISEDEQKWEALKNKEIDLLDVPQRYLIDLSNSNSTEYKDLEQKDIKVKYFSRQATRWLGFNMTDPVVGKNLALRSAIAHAINYDEYVQKITKNTNLRATSIINPSIPGYNPRHKFPFDHDLDKAKSFLKKAGYEPGELTLTYSTRGSQKAQLAEAEFIKENLAKIGINLNINILEFSEFLKLGRSGKLQFWTDNWIYDYPDAENIMQLLITKNHPGINKSGYSNPKVDQLYEELSKAKTRDARFELMYEIERLVEQEIPWILLIYESTYIAHHSDVKNFRKSFFIRNYVKYLQK